MKLALTLWLKSDSLKRAVEKRRALFEFADTDCFRIVNETADGCPGLTVDKFADVLVLSLYREFSASEERALADVLGQELQPKSIYLKRRPQEARRVATVDRERTSPADPLWGDPVESLTVMENGLSFLIRPSAGLSVGLFLDMRDTRQWVRENSAGKTVLNCFAYTCGFAIAARAGKSIRAVNIDASRRVLDWGEENAQLNRQIVDRKDHIAGDVFDWLARFGKKKEAFDLVVLDPPSFSTTRHSRFTAASDYADLCEAASKVVSTQGTLLACCNLAGLSPERLVAMAMKGISAAGRKASVGEILHASPVDFPAVRGAGPHGLSVCELRLDRW